MANLSLEKVSLTPVDEVDTNHLKENAKGFELHEFRSNMYTVMETLQPIIRRANGNKRLYMGEAGRCAALAMTKLEEALMWAERAYLWEGK